MTFFTAIKISDEFLEQRHSEIAKTYLKRWFWIDLTCSFPLEIIDLTPIELRSQNNASDIKILRLARLPRLWRIIRIARLIK